MLCVPYSPSGFSSSALQSSNQISHALPISRVTGADARKYLCLLLWKMRHIFRPWMSALSENTFIWVPDKPWSTLLRVLPKFSRRMCPIVQSDSARSTPNYIAETYCSSLLDASLFVDRWAVHLTYLTHRFHHTLIVGGSPQCRTVYTMSETPTSERKLGERARVLALALFCILIGLFSIPVSFWRSLDIRLCTS